ncbi:MAG: thiamine-phosphate kinase [Alphaproteobacteria bacterium]|nr:thiamine-phosphate kinase [Alphaproteobacteria bacterium]
MTSSSSSRPGEFELIAQLFAPLATDPGAYGLRDDVALLAPPAGQDLVLKTDAIVEGVHFFAADPADLVAQKALRVNVSDLAAKGATPTGYLLSLSIPQQTSMPWLTAFAEGLARDQKAWGISLLGGDTTATPGPVTISISMIGTVPRGEAIRRAGARPGDLVFVTGTIGDAGGGLEILRGGGAQLSDDARTFLISSYRCPSPSPEFGARLRGIASASLDVSDGLMADLGHVAEVSDVRIVVDSAQVPLSEALEKLWGKGVVQRAVVAGDDYQIAFTAPQSSRNAIFAAARDCGVRVSEIGRVEQGSGTGLLDRAGNLISLSEAGYTHF